MKDIRKIAITLLLISACLMPSFNAVFAASIDDVQVMSAPLTRKSSAADGMVRVYLSSLGNPTTLDLTAVGKYSINGNTNQTISSGSNLTVNFSTSTGAITLTHNGVKTNMGTYFALRRHSTTGSNGMKIAQSRESSNPYPGDISFRAVQQGSSYKLYTVAHIYIENYLYGVLPYEMGNSSNIEALKAQAVAARTYTVNRMQSNASGTYDVVDTTSDQVYRGTPSGNANCVAAVDGTKGIVIMNGSNYTATYYSASNGGQMESIKSIWGSTGYDYLDVKDDPFDYANPSSVVKKSTVYADLSSSSNNASLISLLRSKAASQLGTSSGNVTLTTLKSVTPHTPKYASPSRLYTKMDFTLVASVNGASKTMTVTCDIFSELESMLSMSIQSSKNELWSVQKSGTSFVLQARRYGHGLGMSQRGAMYMAKLGYTYDQILGFYYTGCKRVQQSFTNTILDDMGSTQTTVEDPANIDDDDQGTCKATVKLVKADATLAIRTEKSTSAAIIGTASNGAILNVLSNDGTWCFVQYGNLKGYVPSNALSITGTPSNEEGSAATILGFVTVTANDFVNLRSSGSMSGSVVSTAPANAVLTVFSKDGSWAHVQYNATVAYVNTNYVSAITTTYPTNVVSTGNAKATVKTEDGTGTVNMRGSASTSASVVAEITHGTEITVLSDDGSWSYISYNGINGYMISEFILYSGESLENENPQGGNEGETGGSDPADTNETATVISSGGSLRVSPSDGAELLAQVQGGTIVTITEYVSPWCAVTYADQQGYMLIAELTFETGNGGDDENNGNQGEAVSKAVVTTSSGSLNMRTEAKAGSQIITTIPRGMEIEVTLIGSTWCGVRYAGYNGYVMTSFLTFTQGENGGTSSEEGETTATVTTESGTLNLRIEPRAGSAILRTIPRLESIVVHERGALWSRVTYGNTTGYVMTVFLTFSDEKQPDPEEPTTPGDEDGENGEGDETNVNDPDEPITPDPGDDESTYATVTTASGPLNLRSDPLPGSRVLARIPKGTTILITQQHAAWSETTYGGQTGYVMNSFLTFRQGKPEELTGDMAVVTTVSGSLNLRMEPSTASGVLKMIPQYATISVQQRGSTWCYIAYEDIFGYVMTEFLTFNNAQVETETSDESNTEDGKQEESTDVQMAYVQTASGGLNLRVSPNGQVVQSLPRESSVIVLGYGDTWCEVQAGQITGYVMTRYLRFETAISQKQEMDADQSSAGTTGENDDAETEPDTDDGSNEAIDENEGAVATAWVVTPSGPLNLRSEASSDAGVITSIPRHDSVSVIQSGAVWSYVSYHEVLGHVMSEYLSSEKPSEAALPPVEDAASQEPAANTDDDQNSDAEPSIDQGTTETDDGTDQESASSLELILDSTMRVVDTETFAIVMPPEGELRIDAWNQCEEDSEKVLSLTLGDSVEVLMHGEEWCMIEFMGEQGYCLLKYLSI